MDLQAALDAFAQRERVLVALDFDGVLAPIVADPEAARPLPAAARALTELAGRGAVHLALVSGRQLADLRRLADPPPQALLVGSHGAQVRRPGDGPDSGDALTLGPGERELLVRLGAELETISTGHPGTVVEHKPAAVVLHTRRADRQVAAAATALALAGPATWPGTHLTSGKEVVELSVIEATKGEALSRLRTELGLPAGSGGVLYVGDDVTDERAFAVLDDDSGDVTVKVGPGDTLARHRVDGPPEVAELLGLLLDQVIRPTG